VAQNSRSVILLGMTDVNRGRNSSDKQGVPSKEAPRWLSRLVYAPTWKIVIFWVLVAAGLTMFFEPIVAKRAAQRAIQPAVELFCTASSKCT